MRPGCRLPVSASRIHSEADKLLQRERLPNRLSSPTSKEGTHVIKMTAWALLAAWALGQTRRPLLS